MHSEPPVIAAVGISRSGGAPGTPGARETPPAAPTPRRLVLSTGFTVINRQQRRLHDRAHTPGFADLHSYLAARCQDNASLAQLADELGTTVNVIRRLLDHAGLTPPPRRLSAACQRRRATDQRLAARAAQLGFASLPAYLVDRVTQQAWPLTQVAGELGIDRNTVKDCLDRHGLHCGSHTARS
jgi:hypothetical protein